MAHMQSFIPMESWMKLMCTLRFFIDSKNYGCIFFFIFFVSFLFFELFMYRSILTDKKLFDRCCF